MLKNATDFDYYDPQRVYTGEDLAFFGATIMRSLVLTSTRLIRLRHHAGPRHGHRYRYGQTPMPTQWSFTLRDGLTWQDGSPVKCEDIKYGVSRTFATDVINGGPTYAIAYLDIPKTDDGSSPTRAPTAAKARISSIRPSSATATRSPST